MSAITEHEQREERPDDELELRDLDLPEDRAADVTGGRLAKDVSGAARGGGCDEWGCGTNHNEAMSVTS